MFKLRLALNEAILETSLAVGRNSWLRAFLVCRCRAGSMCGYFAYLKSVFHFIPDSSSNPLALIVLVDIQPGLLNIIDEEAKCDSFYFICTNLGDKPPEVAKIKHKRWEGGYPNLYQDRINRPPSYLLFNCQNRNKGNDNYKMSNRRGFMYKNKMADGENKICGQKVKKIWEWLP